ncbi:conserved hypothetical protein [Vibrio chagasii]|nr:conserved hypothetical protein [Vibrio chagasii]CAH6960162.1 conserved hypothetical protein [Vibrio chagasii]CAH7401334.1 conserved hypothetical protein [Vibrio chagasii]
MKLSYDEEIPKHVVDLLVYVFLDQQEEKEPIAILNELNTCWDQKNWGLIEGRGQTQEEAFDNAKQKISNRFSERLNEVTWTGSCNMHDYDERIRLPYYTKFHYLSHKYKVTIVLTQSEFNQLNGCFMSLGSIKAVKYSDKKSRYPHPATIELYANKIIQRDDESIFVDLIRSVESVSPTTEQRLTGLQKLPFDLLCDIDQVGFGGDNIDNRILAYLEDLDPSIINEMR